MRGKKQHVRVEVDPVRPNNGSGFLIHRDLGEKRWVLERCKNSTAPADPVSEVDRALKAIGKGQVYVEVGRYLDFRDIRVHRLLQRCDAINRLASAKATPVVEQFTLMETSPLEHEGQDPRWEVALEWFGRRDRDPSLLAAVSRVEVWGAVIEEVHPDDNTEKTRNLRHDYSYRRAGRDPLPH